MSSLFLVFMRDERCVSYVFMLLSLVFIDLDVFYRCGLLAGPQLSDKREQVFVFPVCLSPIIDSC